MHRGNRFVKLHVFVSILLFIFYPLFWLSSMIPFFYYPDTMLKGK